MSAFRNSLAFSLYKRKSFAKLRVQIVVRLLDVIEKTKLTNKMRNSYGVKQSVRENRVCILKFSVCQNIAYFKNK